MHALVVLVVQQLLQPSAHSCLAAVGCCCCCPTACNCSSSVAVRKLVASQLPLHANYVTAQRKTLGISDENLCNSPTVAGSIALLTSLQLLHVDNLLYFPSCIGWNSQSQQTAKI
jgi:hypothetical protein